MKYKVIVIALLLKNNVKAKYGDEVTDDQLTDSTQNLIKGGYIEEVKPPQPSAADLQKLADEAKQVEIGAAKDALDAANTVLATAKTNAEGAAPELKDAADAAVENAQKDVDAAQVALDALTAPVPAVKKK